jgi:beta-galactosidase
MDLRFTRRQWFQTVAAAAVAAPALSADGIGPGPDVARLSEGWEHYRGNLGGIWEVWRGKAASDNVTWTKVAMPHCFNARDAVDPDEAYYEGPGWYRTSVTVANPYPSGRTLLWFEGAGQRSAVYVGMQKLAEHIGGYDEFTVDITDAVKDSKADVAVFCDNSRNLEMMPSDLSDFARYGGLYRHVHRVYVPAVSIERLHVDSTVGGGKATVSITPRFYNPTGAPVLAPVSLQVTDPKGKVVATTAKFSLDNAILWSPKTPNLYTVTAYFGRQIVTERFGLRWFDFPKHGVFLFNGEKLFLRGTQRHHDHAGFAAAMPDDLIRKEMQMVKDMGANFIRLGHYQNPKLVLDLCDELGLIVWEELCWCRGGVGGPEYKEQGRRMLRNLIEQHRNHPSVVFWGLGNETDWPGDFPVQDKDAIRAYMSELNDIAHKADPTRLTAIRRNDFAKEIPDVYSPSIWAGWYSGRYTEYKASTQKQAAQIDRMLHIEWGGDSHAGRHSEDPDKVIASISTGQGTEEKDRAYLLTGGQARASRDGDWSETYICNLFDWHLKEQETMDFLAGSAMWVFKDFCTPLRPENPVPRVNQKGVLERDLTPKEGYYVFQSYWSEKPMVRLYGHTWSTRWGAPGEAKMVKVYSNCDSAELFLNGKSCGVKKRNSQDFPAAGLRWLVPFQAGENHLRVVAKKGAAEVADEVRFRYTTEKWGKPARIATGTRNANGIHTVDAWLHDADHRQCLDARNVVRFGIAGDGELIQNLGTVRGSRRVEAANGYASIAVRLPKGEAVVSVSVEGLPTAFVNLRA